MIYNITSFERIYRAYYHRVYSFLYKMCHDYDTAEDLTQETFYQAYKSIGKYRGECDMFTWLAAIAKNVWFSHLRKKRLSADSMSVDSVIELWGGERVSPEDSFIKEETAAAVREWIAAMPKKYRDVVVLRIYAGLPFRQVAKAMNITENSAKVLYFRAKNILKERIERENEM